MDDTTRKSIADNMRFYGDARFKQLTLFLTWMTLLAGGFFQFGDKQFAVDMGLLYAIPTYSMLVICLFWILEVRSTLYWRAHRDRSPDLWPSPPKDSWRALNASNAILWLYLTTYIAWYALAVKLKFPVWCLVALALLCVFIFLFGWRTYSKYSEVGSTIESARKADAQPGSDL